MARQLTINGTTYNYPDAGENPGWGEDASAWAEAITDAVSNLTGEGDIPTTTAIIADNVAVPTNITGMKFLTPGTKGFTIYYVINRTDGVDSFNEYGLIHGVYTGTDWEISREYIGESEIGLTITSAGQCQYTSSSIGGVYSGTIVFKTTSSAL